MDADAILRALWADSDPLNWFRNVSATLKLLVTNQAEILNNQAEFKKTLARLTKMADELQVSLERIDAATTAQGKVLAAEATTLQKISDEFDALIEAAKKGTVTPAQLAQAQRLADGAAAIADSLGKQAEFSNAIAAKGQPVTPGPVPEPTPAP